METPFALEQGTGPALVLLHGIGGGALGWPDQLAAWSDRYRVIAWDMPGYGRSPLPERMSWPGLADALAALLDARGIGRAVVLGHSMGGMVAQAFAARHPERVAGLVLSGTSPAFGKAGGAWQREFLSARLKPLDEGKTPADIADGNARAILGEAPDGMAHRRAVALMAAVPAATYRAALTLLVTFDGRADLPRIAVPTLCLAGGKDTVAPPEVMEGMAKRIAGADYVVIPGAGHLANLERPTAFNAAVEGFLERRLAADGACWRAR
ncbi:MAG: alpha/beta fold hydrolase [Alphaproteobacteria bacterium]|nr:alpha/beta fold hydrolase [Alphaproteobacteria bacterium]